MSRSCHIKHQSGHLFLITLTFALLMFSNGAQAKQQSTKALQQEWQQTLQQHNQARSGVRFPYEHCFDKASARYGISKPLLLAVARGESDFNPTAVSHANAIGMMQILWPGTARHLGIWRKSALYDPCTNIDAGTRYLKELIQHYKGDINLVLSAYNYGPGRIKVNAQQVPKGAAWYSSYILRHYRYVTAAGATKTKLAKLTNPQPKKSLDYRKVGKLELIRFDRPYRAQAYIESLKTRAPDLQLDWFRMSNFQYRVVASYKGSNQLNILRKRLGFLGVYDR